MFDIREAEPLYLRPQAILVRPGNANRIGGFRDVKYLKSPAAAAIFARWGCHTCSR